MPPKIVPPDKNGAAEYLIFVFQRTEKKLIAEIERKRRMGYVDYAELAALRRVRETLQKMVDESAEYIPLAIEHEFYEGYAARMGYKNAENLVNPGRTKAIEQLVDNLLGEVEEMAATAYQSTAEQLFVLGSPNPDIFRQAGLEAAASALAEGLGPLRHTEELVESVQKAGITAFVDKAGRRWSLTDYGNMAVRTTVRQAQVSAVLTEGEHDLYKIMTGRYPCRVCAVYGNRVYSKSGNDPNYPSLARAFGKIDPAGPDDLSNTFLNIHPNCLCTLLRYTEKGKTDKQIQRTREQSNRPFEGDPRSKKQIEAYREKERNRAKYRRELKKKLAEQENLKAKTYSRARNIRTPDDLLKVSKSPIIDMESHEDIQKYFEKTHNISIKGFNQKDLFQAKSVLAGYDDMLSEFPEIKSGINTIKFNPRIKDCGIIDIRKRLSQVGPAGLGDYGTGVHESAHVLDFFRSPYSGPSYAEQTILQAKKNLKLKKSEMFDLVTQIVGLSRAKDKNDPAEVFAYAIETAKGGVNNKLASEIYRLTKGGPL